MFGCKKKKRRALAAKTSADSVSAERRKAITDAVYDLITRTDADRFADFDAFVATLDDGERSCLVQLLNSMSPVFGELRAKAREVAKGGDA